MLLCVLLKAALQSDIIHGRVLGVSELGEDHRGNTLSGWAVVRDIAGRGRIYAEGVEAVAVQPRLDDLAYYLLTTCYGS